MDLDRVVAVVFVSLVVALVLGLLWAGRWLGRGGDPLGRVRGRLVTSVGVLLGVLVLMMAWDSVLFGVAYTLAAPVSAAAGLLAFGVVPWREPERERVRSAALQRRTLLTVAGRVEPGLVALVLGLTAVVVVVSMPFSASDGHSIQVVSRDGGSVSTSTSEVYPGWVFGSMILAGLAVLAVATVIALRRAALLPAIGTGTDGDARWRRRSTRTVLSVAAAGGLLEAAMVLYSLDSALRVTAESDETRAAGLHVAVQVVAPLALLGGIGALVASVVLAALVTARRVDVPALAAPRSPVE